MPIEIKELVIRVAVDPAPEAATPPAGLDREALIAECVEETLRVLRRSQER